MCLSMINCPRLFFVMKVLSLVYFKLVSTQKIFDQQEWYPLSTKAFKSSWRPGSSPTDVSPKEILVGLNSTPASWRIVRPGRMFSSSFAVCLTMEQ